MGEGKPTLAVWKFSSCDGCQLSLLDCEDELLAVAGAIDIAYFLEATRAEVAGPYDVSLVERGMSPARVYVSMERNMKCAVGHCGHCQLGPEFICRDGPVFSYERMRHAFRIREL